jgi:hypothetical protein
MKSCVLALLLATGAAFGESYKLEPASGAPSELPQAFSALLQKEGVKIVGENGPFAELWFRTDAPSGEPTAESDVNLPTIPHGAFLGAIRFPERGADRRGQAIKPGLYTLRYSHMPMNGDHLGASPNRDFLVMVPAEVDTDPNAKPGFDELMNMSRKASGTPHPAVLSLYKASEAGTAPAIVKDGEHDWAVTTKLGDLPIGLIIIGRSEH